MNSKYIEWLQNQGVQLYKVGREYWRMYQGALVPASVAPLYIDISRDESKRLLKLSGAYFIRYASHPCDYETEWWDIICDQYDPKKRSAKTRQNVNRGNRCCSVRMIDSDWLANHGYECYSSAYARYQNATPDNKEIFADKILSTKSGPFEYWGIFVGDVLAGYCQCIVVGNNVITNITKYDPEQLRNRTAYALISHLIEHYVVTRGMVLSNSNRSIAHDTNYQDVLINIGFRKKFCRLNVMYKPWVALIIQLLYPFRRYIKAFSDNRLMHKLQSVLFQEELRRSFLT